MASDIRTCLRLGIAASLGHHGWQLLTKDTPNSASSNCRTSPGCWTRIGICRNVSYSTSNLLVVCLFLTGTSIILIGLGNIGRGLLSRRICVKPVVVELVRSVVTQGLMGAHRLVGVIPGQQGLPQPAQISREVLDWVELLLVGAEASLNAPVAHLSSAGQALRVVGPVEVVGQLEFCNRSSELLQELASPIRLYGLDLEGEWATTCFKNSPPW